jgi:hypothetical protein
MFDPRLTTMMQVWFSAFGSRHRKVKDLLRESPGPLLELFLRFGHDPDDRHQISPRHLGIFLSHLVRGPPISGFQMRSRQANNQAAFSLVDATDADVPGTPPAVHSTVQRPIPADIQDEDVMEAALTLAKYNLNDALRSQDLALIQEAEERLTMVAAAIDRARWSRDDWHRYFGNKGRLWLR